MPSSAFWREISEEPDDFDPEKVWAFTAKLISSSGTKRRSCIFCPSQYASWNATKVLYRHAGISGKDIALCPGASNGQQPAWLTASLRACIVRKGAVKEKKKDVSLLNF